MFPRPHERLREQFALSGCPVLTVLAAAQQRFAAIFGNIWERVCYGSAPVGEWFPTVSQREINQKYVAQQVLSGCSAWTEPGLNPE